MPSLVERPAALIGELLTYDPLIAARCLLETEDVEVALSGQVGEALARREQAGTGSEREEATELLARLHAAGVIPDVSVYREMVAAQIE